VKVTQTKNGFPAFFCRLMKSAASSGRGQCAERAGQQARQANCRRAAGSGEKNLTAITANIEWATKQRLEVGNLPIGNWNARASDKIRAIEVLAKMHGWNAAEKTNLTGDWKRRVRLNVTYSVEPKPQEENPT
jgi:hypothetical protein